MYRDSGEQIFARVERIRFRAQRLLAGGETTSPAPPDDDAEREAVALSARVELRLPGLLSTFQLDALAGDVIICLVAAEFDPFMRTVVRALQRELGRPWIELGTIAELLDLPPSRVPVLAGLFSPGGPIRRWSLALVDESVEAPVVATRVKIATRVAQHLVGDDRLPEGLRLVEPRAALADSLVPREAAHTVLGRLRRALSTGERVLLEIVGAPGTGRRFLAEGLARELDVPLLVAELGALDRVDRIDRLDRHERLAERLAEARREALLSRALLCLADWDTHAPPVALGEDAAGQPLPSAPRRLPGPIARFVEQLDGPVLLTGEEREPLFERHGPAVVHVDVPFPSPSQRAALLAAAIERAGGRLDAEVDPLAIARRFALDPARIDVASRAAVELAREAPPAETGDAATDDLRPRITRGALSEACRRQLRHDLKSLAVRVTASHKWEDLVIPSEVYEGLCEMISYVRHATKVYDEWGFGARHSLAMGVSALFAGPPGTGKTMCASVMARELDMELFRVDLSRVVSKWIGETEKNLGKVFDEAQRSNAIILFDEADSLFAKRTDVKSSVDRYANLEVNFLLQRMEAFGGVTILTTNFEDTIDTAFKRRLTFRMRFEKPDAEARAALWRKMFPSGAQLARDIDWKRLAENFEMSGGNIRNAAVRAAFLAAEAGRPIDMKMCETAAERESREMGLLTRSILPSKAERQKAEAQLAARQTEEHTDAPKLRPIGRPRSE